MKSKKTMIAIIGSILILGIICLGLSLSPIRLQVDGWQVEVVRLIEKTPTSTDIPLSTGAPVTPQSTWTATSVDSTAAAGKNSYIVTDQTWKFSRTPLAGWEQLTYDDSGWSAVGILPCYELPGVKANCLWDYPYHFIENDTLYFRKVFNIADIPPQARIVTQVDDDVDVFLNEKLVLHDTSHSASFLEADARNALQPGMNVLALRGVDIGKGFASVQAVLGLCYDMQDKYDPIVVIMSHQEDWFDGKLRIEALDAPCDSGVAEIAYQIDGGTWQVVQSDQIFQLPLGEHDVRARATDQTGRQGFDAWHFRVGSPSTTENGTAPE